MILFSIFGIILLSLGVELIREGIVKNTQFVPRYKTNEGDKEVIVGIFLVLAGLSTFLTIYI